MNMPGVSAPWKYNTGDIDAIMHVSIFPEVGFDSTAFDANGKIEIDASEAAFTTSPYIESVATAKSAVKLDYAMTMGLSVAALAVSASLF